MSLVQIKRGIIDKDWELVTAGYEAITGEALVIEEQVVEAPKKRRGRPPKKPAVVEEVVEEDEEDEVPLARKSPKIQKRKIVTKVKRENLFVDDLSQETRYLQKAKKPPARVDNDRPKFEKIQVICTKCHKARMESPTIVALNQQGIGKYICSKCVKGGIG